MRCAQVGHDDRCRCILCGGESVGATARHHPVVDVLDAPAIARQLPSVGSRERRLASDVLAVLVVYLNLGNLHEPVARVAGRAQSTLRHIQLHIPCAHGPSAGVHLHHGPIGRLWCGYPLRFAPLLLRQYARLEVACCALRSFAVLVICHHLPGISGSALERIALVGNIGLFAALHLATMPYRRTHLVGYHNLVGRLHDATLARCHLPAEGRVALNADGRIHSQCAHIGHHVHGI